MATSIDRIRWAFVGLGNVVVNRFAPALAQSGRSQLVACSSRDIERARAFASRFGAARVHATFDDLVRDPGIDVVYLATPNSLHHAQVRQALIAGKHVLCEKPLALDAGQGRELARLADERRLRLHVAYQFRFESVFRSMREQVRVGAIGEPRTLTLTGVSPVMQGATWRANPGEGGILSDLGVHLLDLASWIVGHAFTGIAARSIPADPRVEAARTVSVLGTLGARCHAFVRASREVPQGQQAIAIEGTEGSLACPAWRGANELELTLVDQAGRRVERLAPEPLFEREIAAFEAELAGQSTDLATADEAIRTIEAASAVFASASSGHWVSLPPRSAGAV